MTRADHPARPIRNGYGLRRGPCRRPGCKRRVPKSSIYASYCGGACQVAAWRERKRAATAGGAA